MDAFETIIGQLLTENMYWIKHSVKIDLSPEEKRSINKPSTPRPEIDIAAYKVNTDTLYLLEVKSFLDSPGVYYDEVAIEQDEQSGRYKLLTTKNYRQVLSERLKQDWCESVYIPDYSVPLFRSNVYHSTGKVYHSKVIDSGESVPLNKLYSGQSVPRVTAIPAIVYH